MSIKTIQDIEQGRHLPRPETAERLGIVMGVQPEWLAAIDRAGDEIEFDFVDEIAFPLTWEVVLSYEVAYPRAQSEMWLDDRPEGVWREWLAAARQSQGPPGS